MFAENVNRALSGFQEGEFGLHRKSGLLFASKSGRPLQQSNILRRTLHPILAELSQPKCGAHAFRRFRNTYLRNYTLCPEGLRKFWLGWSDQDMSDLYDKIREDVAFRKEWAEKAVRKQVFNEAYASACGRSRCARDLQLD